MKSECADDVFVDVAAEVRLEVAQYFLFSFYCPGGFVGCCYQ